MAPKILLVDDETGFAQLLAISLLNDGYEVVLADNGRDALDKLKRMDFNIVITDINMPEMSGFDLVEKLKRLPRSPEVIMISGVESPEYLAKAQGLGVYGLVRKPASKKIKAMISKALAKTKDVCSGL